MRELLQLSYLHSLVGHFEFNVSKCTMAIFRPALPIAPVAPVVHAQLPFLLGAMEVPLVSRFMYLGVDIDVQHGDLFSSHRSRVLTRCRRASLDIRRLVLLRQLRNLSEAMELWQAAMAGVEYAVAVYLTLSPFVPRQRFLRELSQLQSNAILAMCGLGSPSSVGETIRGALECVPGVVLESVDSVTFATRLTRLLGVLEPERRLRMLIAFWCLDHALSPVSPPARHPMPLGVVRSARLPAACIRLSSSMMPPLAIEQAMFECRSVSEMRPRLRAVIRAAALRVVLSPPGVPAGFPRPPLDPVLASLAHSSSARVARSASLSLSSQHALLASRIGWTRVVAAAAGRLRPRCACVAPPTAPAAALAHAVICPRPSHEVPSLTPSLIAVLDWIARSPEQRSVLADRSDDVVFLGDLITGGPSLLGFVGASEFDSACRRLAEWLASLLRPP